MKQNLILRIIYPSSRDRDDESFENRRLTLTNMGHEVRFDPLPSDTFWPHASSTIALRRQELVRALCEPDTDAILCARGGYGASDLIDQLPWGILAELQPKWLVGFSDISALLSAIYTKLGWRTMIHGPVVMSDMTHGPAFSGNSIPVREDIRQVFAFMEGATTHGSMSVEHIYGNAQTEAVGTLFGGCFSVLSNLIATPYLPPLQGCVLFFEDTHENPGRLLRCWNQWLHAGLLNGVRAVVIGNLKELDSPLDSIEVKREFGRRSGLPIYSSEAFGHIVPNFPLVLGAQARLTGNELQFEI